MKALAGMRLGRSQEFLLASTRKGHHLVLFVRSKYPRLGALAEEIEMTLIHPFELRHRNPRWQQPEAQLTVSG